MRRSEFRRLAQAASWDNRPLACWFSDASKPVEAGPARRSASLNRATLPLTIARCGDREPGQRAAPARGGAPANRLGVHRAEPDALASIVGHDHYRWLILRRVPAQLAGHWHDHRPFRHWTWHFIGPAFLAAPMDDVESPALGCLDATNPRAAMPATPGCPAREPPTLARCHDACRDPPGIDAGAWRTSPLASAGGCSTAPSLALPVHLKPPLRWRPRGRPRGPLSPNPAVRSAAGLVVVDRAPPSLSVPGGVGCGSACGFHTNHVPPRVLATRAARQ